MPSYAVSKTDEIPADLIEQVITAATWAPSPGNSQGRDFVIVTDKEKIQTIANSIEGSMAARVASMDRPDKSHRLMLDGTEYLLKRLKVVRFLCLCAESQFTRMNRQGSHLYGHLYIQQLRT